MNDDQDQKIPVWPPAIVPDQAEVMPKASIQVAPKTLRGIIFGLLCGFVLSLIIGVSVMVACMNIGGAMIMDGADFNARTEAQLTAKVIEFLLLGSPLLVWILSRTRYPSFAIGQLIGGFLLNLCFLKLFFF